MKVERVFNRNIVHTTSSATLEQAARLMRDRHVGALLVTEDAAGKKPVGMVTDRDLVIRALAEGAGAQESHHCRSDERCACHDPAILQLVRSARAHACKWHAAARGHQA